MADLIPSSPATGGEFLLYQTEDGRTRLEVRVQHETVWLSLNQMAEQLQASYAELERGTRSTEDLRVWVAIAATLQLGPEELLRKVWATRGSLPLALPPREDPRHAVILKLAIEQAGVDDVLLALRATEDSASDSG